MSNLPAAPAKGALINHFANKYGIDNDKVLSILRQTCFKQPDKNGKPVVATNEQCAALLVVAREYGLNPFVKEIYAFPDKQGGIVPIVGVDGWSRIVNDHPDMEGVEFVYSDSMAKIDDHHKPAFEWIECHIWRKGRRVPIKIREYFDEVYRPPFEGTNYKTGEKYLVSGPWQTHPKRMHRHKALKEAGRVAFGYAGIRDEDEAEEILDITPATAKLDWTIISEKRESAEQLEIDIVELAGLMEVDPTWLSGWLEDNDVAKATGSESLSAFVAALLESKEARHKLKQYFPKPENKNRSKPDKAAKSTGHPVKTYESDDPGLVLSATIESDGEVIDLDTGEVYEDDDPGPMPNAAPTNVPDKEQGDMFSGPEPWKPTTAWVNAVKTLKLDPRAAKRHVIDFYGREGVEGHQKIEEAISGCYNAPESFKAWAEQVGLI